ncbi:hypothetical protein RH831_10820 [Halodesulfurarchaeum sp. HSR-GB]|uniref:DUF6908 domain-containing protein n=1 Tax=Halodesulfurarchaeum sp. HSR-GB TaxID=3074077 RepID=UPI00285EFADA|nr:hypothetical protein [Halodesulfurarchaeum sp. HSR-GB]MDR5657668.1 hypothetical protein [Halodesulfurarchaeum sp. HSR-GB]
MKTIKEILDSLEAESPEELELGEGYTIKADGSMDLTIEKIAEHRLSVAHYFKQRGDLMRDPEIVFDVSDEDWTPIEFRTDPHTHDYDENGLGINDFLNLWNRNLRNQRFVKNAEDESMVEHLGDS